MRPSHVIGYSLGGTFAVGTLFAVLANEPPRVQCGWTGEHYRVVASNPGEAARTCIVRCIYRARGGSRIVEQNVSLPAGGRVELARGDLGQPAQGTSQSISCM